MARSCDDTEVRKELTSNEVVYTQDPVIANIRQYDPVPVIKLTENICVVPEKSRQWVVEKGLRRRSELTALEFGGSCEFSLNSPYL